MKILRKIFACSLFLLALQWAVAQPPSPQLGPLKVEYLGVEDGLPQRTVQQLLQDQQGFVWIATNGGIYRYDGYQFLPIRKLAKNGRLLPALPAVMYLQKDGTLLFLVGKSQFFLYDPAQNTVGLHPIHAESGRQLLPMYYHDIVIEDKGSFLFEIEENQQRYLLRYRWGKGLQKLDSVDHRIQEVHTLCKDQSGHVFWGTPEGGIRRYGPDGNLAEVLKIADAAGLGREPSFAFYASINSKNKVLVAVASTSKMMHWDWQNAKQIPIEISRLPMTYTKGQNGNDWLINPTNLFMEDSENMLYDQAPYLKGVSDFTIFTDVMEDAQGQVWVATDNGILRFSNSKKPFAHYLNNPHPAWGKTTRGFFEDEAGTVYFRCENCGNEADKTIYRINEASGQAELVPFSYPATSPPQPFGWTKAMLQIPGQNTVWAVGSKGLLQMNIKERRVEMHPAIPSALVNNATGWIGCGMTRKGEILAGGMLDQLFVFDPTTGEIKPLLNQQQTTEVRYNISTILEAKNGAIWVGTGQGLFHISREKGQILRKYSAETSSAFSTSNILTLLEDKDGSIWAGTFGGGLVHIFPETGEAMSYTTADGLCNNDVTAMLPFQADYLWVSTFNGLSLFNKKDKSFVNYYEEDGLTHNEFNVTSAFVDSRGRYYFGGMNGVNAFYPSEILKPQTPLLPLMLTGFSFYDEKKDAISEQMGGLQALAEVTLNPHTSWFQFNYALPQYANPRLNQFKTWLENFEKDWIYQGNSPFIRYNRLPAGDYILHIRAADSKGYWSDDELAIRITVQQVFYKTWWFILLCCLAVGAGGFALLRYRYQQRLALEQMRTRIASDLHDEVGSSLSHLNFLVGSFDMENSPETTAKAIEKSKELMRKTASNIRDVVWAIDARRDKTGDLLDRMEDFAFDMFSVKNIACRFQTDGVNREAVLNPFVRQNIFLVFKEAVNNIAKHSNATEVSISLSQTGNSLELTVADNGTNTSPDKPSTGLGLENMQMRAKRIGGSVAIENSGTGWTVRLRVA